MNEQFEKGQSVKSLNSFPHLYSLHFEGV